MASSLVCSLPSLPRPSGRLQGPKRVGGAPRGIAVAALWRGGVAFASSPDDSMVQVVRNAALKREGAADDVQEHDSVSIIGTQILEPQQKGPHHVGSTV